MNKKKKKQNGFTIVELVIVIAVIGILAAVLIPTFSNLVKKAKESADQQLVYHINVAAAANEVDNGKAPTMYDTLQALENDYGFTIEKMTPRSGCDIVWDSVTNRFALVENGTTIKYSDPNKPSNMTNKAQMWKITTPSDSLEDGYSHYLTADWEGEVPNASTGLDVGENDDITAVTYAHDGEAQTVVIRTNSANTTLTIDDKSTGTINHYGSAGELNIIQCHTASYHENGNVAFAEIAKGRIVLESGSEIKHIHVNAKEDDSGNSLNEFDTIIIADNGARALPEAITRDQVDVSEAKAVVTVESGSTSETVYVYPYTDAQETKTGTTEKTDTQNTSVVSALGQLVLDNGSDAGEKAMSNNEKTEAKTELVNEAKAPEMADKLEENIDAVVYNLTTQVYYNNLYTAIDEAPANTKQTLVLLKDISNASNENYEIPANKVIVLDLNGKVINTVAPDESTAYTIVNKGTLTIKDNTDTKKNGSGTGKITSSAVKPDMQDVPGYASNTITNHGNLTIESGIIENRGAGYACFAIDNQTNGTLYTPELIINGGRMLQESAKHYAVRMFCNSTTNVNKVTVNGGIIEGGYGLWLQIPNSNADKAELIINGGTIQAKDGYSLFVGGSGATNDTRNYTETTIIINGGNIDSMGLAGVSDSARTLKMFEINGGNIGGLAYGPNINPVIASNVVIPE